MSTSLKETSLGNFINHFSLLSGDLVWLRVFQNEPFKRWIMDLVRQDQLFKHGIDEDGDVIGEYSEATEMMNPQKLAGTHYTLFDTGDFYNSFVIFVGNQYFEIEADTVKMESENWWVINSITKNAILGLTDENKTKLAFEVKKRYIKEARLLLGIG
jgi:hypothetical protein